MIGSFLNSAQFSLLDWLQPKIYCFSPHFLYCVTCTQVLLALKCPHGDNPVPLWYKCKFLCQTLWKMTKYTRIVLTCVVWQWLWILSRLIPRKVVQLRLFCTPQKRWLLQFFVNVTVMLYAYWLAQHCDDFVVNCAPKHTVWMASKSVKNALQPFQ